MATTTTTLTSSWPADPLAELNRLLGRLQLSTLRADAERQQSLAANEFERRKADTSIKHARTLLTRLEHEALLVKVHARRQALQAALNRHRELIDELAERIRDLDDMADSQGVAHVDDGDDEDLLNAVGSSSIPSASRLDIDTVPADGESQPSAEHFRAAPGHRPEPGPEMRVAGTAIQGPDGAMQTSLAPKSPTSGTTGVVSSQTLRARAPVAEPDSSRAVAATGRSLFGDAADARASSTSQVATTESILDQQRAEQDLLSESILRMASSLKQSSQAFSNSLEEDKNVLGRAGEGLNKNEQGLEAAARRMGALTRMAEGEGLMGRLLLYGMVYGLMLFLVLLVFVVPKFRF